MDFVHSVSTVDSSKLYISPTSVQRVALRGEKPKNRPVSNQNIGVCSADNPASKIQQNKSKKQTSNLFDPFGGVRSPIHTMLTAESTHMWTVEWHQRIRGFGDDVLYKSTFYITLHQ